MMTAMTFTLGCCVVAAIAMWFVSYLNFDSTDRPREGEEDGRQDTRAWDLYVVDIKDDALLCGGEIKDLEKALIADAEWAHMVVETFDTVANRQR